MKSALVLLFSITLLLGSGFSQVNGDFRTINSGTWTTAGIWETFSAGSWVAAGASPTAATAQTITIQNGHNVTISAALSIDQTIINAGGTITWSTGILTIADGVGVDLIVNGTFIDNCTSNAAFTGSPTGAKWQLNAGANYIKQRTGSAVVWRDNYQGTMAAISPTSNWIIRKNSASNPTFTTVGGTFYGNFIIENTTGALWTMGATSQFTGTTDFPTIYGNFDIGNTTSTGNIIFTNVNTFTTAALVQGNMIVRSGNTYNNYGTGTTIQGNLINLGTIAYDANDGRNLNFTGGNNQTITNTGTLGIYNFTINKSANTLTLNNSITVDNIATFTNGIVNSSTTNLFILNTAATVTGASNASFVNGPVRRLGATGITFPVGKIASYRPISIGNGTVGAPINIYTEDFNSGAASWTLNQVTGTEGADANFFTISSNEGGCQSTFPPATAGIVPNLGAPGSCGTVNTNATLHVTSVFNPTGGAAYDAGGLCGLLFCPQSDRRCLTPIINTTGYSGLELAFDYIEGGSGVLDNAMVYYSIDGGTSWLLLDDMPKSSTAGCAGQGLWVTRVLSLPATCNNNPLVRFAFTWINNDDGVGTDPSFALDNVIVRQAAPISIFTAEYFPTNPQIPYGNILVPTLTALSDCEYWILDRNAGTDSRTVTLSWNAASCYNTAFASFQVARHDGISTWQDHDGIVAGSASGGTVTTPAVVTSFSPFAIAYVPLPLPIELMQFNAECMDGKVKLFWQTATETNNDYFTIENSTDMIEWKELRKIDGAGNSNVILSYETIDSNPEGSTYYRLSQTDLNGETRIFDPVFVNCISKNNGIKVYPNPSTGIVNIEIPSGSVIEEIEVLSSLGQAVLKLTTPGIKGGTIHPLDLSQLSSGTYYLRILMDGNRITKPLNILK